MEKKTIFDYYLSTRLDIDSPNFMSLGNLEYKDILDKCYSVLQSYEATTLKSNESIFDNEIEKPHYILMSNEVYEHAPKVDDLKQEKKLVGFIIIRKNLNHPTDIPSLKRTIDRDLNIINEETNKYRDGK